MESVEALELAIVVPVYNEGESVAPVLRELSASVRTRHEIVVVYDFDGDSTVPVIERLSRELPNLRGLRNDLGRGVLNAMRAGIGGTSAPFVLISMADGSDEPRVIDDMVALARDGADVVAASRYMRGGRQLGGPFAKRTLSRLAGLSLHLFGGVPTHDPTNNFKLYARRFLDVIQIESVAGFELALELTVKATLLGRPVAEVPTTWRDRTAGESNFKLRKWLPHYLHWYAVAMAGRWQRASERSSRHGESPSRSLVGGLHRAMSRIGLPAWFVAIDLAWVARLDVLGIDARHYQRAATEWLAGGDPWSVVESGFHYAAGPHTLLLYAPTAGLPLSASTGVWMAVGIAASVWTVRRLGLPIWWIAFPPLAHAMWNGNPQTLVLALLVAGTAPASALAVLVKLYAGLQLLFRPRHLVWALGALVLTLPFVPWMEYLRQYPVISSHVDTAWNGGAWRLPIIIPPVIVALWVLRRHGGEWLAVPALWPAIQFYYLSFALPLVANRGALAAAFAIPVPLMAPAVAIGLAAAHLARARFRSHAIWQEARLHRQAGSGVIRA